MNLPLSIPSHDHCKDKMAWTSLGGNWSPRKHHRGSSYPDKNKGRTKRPQALAIVLLVHAYSPTVIADWNHRMFLVISFPRMWKRTRDWSEINPPAVRLYKIFFSLVLTVVPCKYCMYLQKLPYLNHYLVLNHIISVSTVTHSPQCLLWVFFFCILSPLCLSVSHNLCNHKSQISLSFQ